MGSQNKNTSWLLIIGGFLLLIIGTILYVVGQPELGSLMLIFSIAISSWGMFSGIKNKDNWK